MFKAKIVFLVGAIVLNYNLQAIEEGNIRLAEIYRWKDGVGRLVEFQIAGKQQKGQPLTQEDKLNLQRIRDVKAFLASQRAEIERLADLHRVQQAEAFIAELFSAAAGDSSGFKCK